MKCVNPMAVYTGRYYSGLFEEGECGMYDAQHLRKNPVNIGVSGLKNHFDYKMTLWEFIRNDFCVSLVFYHFCQPFWATFYVT